MGDLSHAMRNLVDEIRSSTENRQVRVSEMKSDIHNLMERFHLERQDMAKALSEKFASDKSARLDATNKLISEVRSFMDDVGSELKDMAKSLEKLSSDRAAGLESTNKFMSDVRSELEDMAKSLEEKLSSDRAAGLEATKRFMSDVRSEFQDMVKAMKEKLSSDKTARKEATRSFIGALASDRQGAGEIWRSVVRGKGAAKPKPVAEKAAPREVDIRIIAAEEAEEASVQPSADSTSMELVLETIAKHSEGIKLVDIGNELGVDWRGLIGAVKSLVDEGKVDKISNLYYPKS